MKTCPPKSPRAPLTGLAEIGCAAEGPKPCASQWKAAVLRLSVRYRAGCPKGRRSSSLEGAGQKSLVDRSRCPSLPMLGHRLLPEELASARFRGGKTLTRTSAAVAGTFLLDVALSPLFILPKKPRRKAGLWRIEAALNAAPAAEPPPPFWPGTGRSRAKNAIEPRARTPSACAKMFCAEGASDALSSTAYAPNQILPRVSHLKRFRTAPNSAPLVAL